MQANTTVAAHPVILTGAYGQRYTTADQALAAWNEGKDFKLLNGPYCAKDNAKQLLEYGNVIVCLLATKSSHGALFAILEDAR